MSIKKLFKLFSNIKLIAELHSELTKGKLNVCRMYPKNLNRSKRYLYGRKWTVSTRNLRHFMQRHILTLYDRIVRSGKLKICKIERFIGYLEVTRWTSQHGKETVGFMEVVFRSGKFSYFSGRKRPEVSEIIPRSSVPEYCFRFPSIPQLSC
jgi:hypothetical protein